MNELDVSLQAVYNASYNTWCDLFPIFLFAMLAALVLTPFLILFVRDTRWKKQIEHFLPEIAREKIKERDLVIKEQLGRIEKLELDISHLKSTAEGLNKLTSKMVNK